MEEGQEESKRKNKRMGRRTEQKNNEETRSLDERRVPFQRQTGIHADTYNNFLIY